MKESTLAKIRETAVGDLTLDHLKQEVERQKAELLGYGPPPQVIYCNAAQAEWLKSQGLTHD